jgi:Fic family protein
MFNPTFTITNNLLNSISKIEAARQIIENAPLIPAWERRFREEAEERTIFFSTKIEGGKLNFKEAKKVIGGEKVETIRRRDVKEIVNYREVVEFISKLRDKPIIKELILKIHKKVMSGILPSKELGAFRECEEALVNSETDEVVFEPVEAEFVEGEIENLIEWIEKKSGEVNPILKAGIILHEISRIHPFTDGNGRASRVLATYSLYSDGYDIKRFFSLEEYYDQNLQEYYDALASVDENDDDMTNWLEFFTKGLAVELSRVKKKILDISSDVKLRKDIGQIALSDRQIKIINFIQEHGYIRNKDWQDLFPLVSDDTILRELNDLKEKKVVKKKGRTKAARYVLK